MEEKDLSKFMIIAVILALAVLAFLIVKPIVVSIFLGLLFAYIFYPLYVRLCKKIKSKNLVALIIVIGTLLIILLPILFLIPSLIKQIFESYMSLRATDFSQVIFKLFPTLANSKEVMTEVIAASSHFNTAISQYLLSIFQDTLMNIPAVIFGVVILLFTFFFGLKEGEDVKGYLDVFFPFAASHQKRVYEKFNQVTGAIIYGEIVVGIAQGVIAGIGYFMFGVPKALLLTVLTILVGVIPIIGPWLVWLPADIFLFIHGNNVAGMQLLIYGAFVINWVDTLLRPIVIAKKAQMNEAIALIGAVGGIYAFGLIGFILGPLVLAYLILLIEIYKGEKERSIIIRKPEEESSLEPKSSKSVKSNL